MTKAQLIEKLADVPDDAVMWVMVESGLYGHLHWVTIDSAGVVYLCGYA